MTSDNLLLFNGVNAATGGYLSSPMSVLEIEDLVRKVLLGKDKELVFGFDPDKLDTAGWGIVTAAADPGRDAILKALQPLVSRREDEAGGLFKQLVYRQGETKREFLARHGAAAGPSDPREVPWYLLLAGDPEHIPFELQYQLDVSYSVGRLHFATTAGYCAYADSVVAAETSNLRRPRTATFFAVEHADDRATELSTQYLVTPLVKRIRDSFPTWGVATTSGAAATRTELGRYLGGADTPALLFTSSHGVGFPAKHPLQADHQGALLCADWPGPRAWTKPVPPEFYFHAGDLGTTAKLHGMVTFHFACYGAGTPRFDAFSHRKPGPPEQIAPKPIVSALPKALLSHAHGGALAVIGHVERAWACSYLWGGVGSQTEVFQDALSRLLAGQRVGMALSPLNRRYAELSTELSHELFEHMNNGPVPAEVLAGLWTANNDARSYVLLGDPAVRLAVEPEEVHS
ncbi:MAG TPA: hypothetical protein VF017_18630 [Thermoanaerobaculia bacterium]|nr:hypothetical protein [Thermoanaerobaculia bacterium]